MLTYFRATLAIVKCGGASHWKTDGYATPRHQSIFVCVFVYVCVCVCNYIIIETFQWLKYKNE